ncbi:MAG TPA: hypothetical protein VHT92_04985, partial [Candidatus Cybelea sp.]|nr:hypothetical protein [Candidatus Cybelea sp.]
MNLYPLPRCGIVLTFAAAALAGCGASSLIGGAPQSDASAARTISERQAIHEARPACPQTRRDEITCYALILNTRVQP